MPSTHELQRRIESSIPGATAQVEDLTGGGDHFRAEVVSDRFGGLSRIEQHKLVYDVFGDELGGAIHALSIKTSTPEGDAMTNDQIRDFLQQAIDENGVMLFMKGTPDQPRCGFSARTAAALNALGVKYAALDILPDPRIKEELVGISGWPTSPQLFIEGKLVGGCDIVMEMYESGELAEALGVEQPADDKTPDPPAAEAPESAPLGIENRLS